MSTRSVKSKTIELLIQNGGRMTEAAMKNLVVEAEKGILTSGEKAALVQPGSFLMNSTRLAQAGIDPSKIVYDDAATKLAQSLAQQYGLTPFPTLGHGTTPIVDNPPADPVVNTSTPSLPAQLKAAVTARDAAVGKGTDLGDFTDWAVKTSGADLSFHTDVNGTKYPALVINKPQWVDPAPQDLVEANAVKFKGLSSLAELKTFVDDVIKNSSDYFAAKGVAVQNVNEQFGIQAVRRGAFFGTLRSRVAETRLSGAERAAIEAVLVPAFESLIVNRDYNMKVGSHENYWPYWNNYVDFMVKVLDQTAPSSEDFKVIKNRVSDILRRKTVFSWNRSIDEKDFEKSLGCALTYNPKWSSDVGHRVSLKSGSTTYNPSFETLSVKDSGLPDSLKAFAGAHVFRDTDDTLYFDFMGKDAAPNRTGQKVSDELAKFLTSADVAVGDLGMRKLESGERARDNVSMDWDSNGSVNIAKIMIGWWGHCHNEAPANASGIDPAKGANYYRADRAVSADKASRSYSEEDIWDIVGAFTADHEEGYIKRAFGEWRRAQVGATEFVGERNNGGNWLTLEFSQPGQRRVRLDAKVEELWHKSDPSKKYADPMRRFRRDIENSDGSFSENPDWVASGMKDEDIIAVDAKGRKMVLETKYITLDSSGMPYEATSRVTLDPSNDAFVKLSEELSDRKPAGGGKVMEHHYNPKSGEYKTLVFDVKQKDGAWTRDKIEETQPVTTSGVTSAQETTFDSVIGIHEFSTKDIGLPFTFDTTAGKAVWNYPVSDIRIDLTQTVEKDENGEKFTYTTYRLTYDTMGGPSGDSRYIIKRDAKGETVRAVALDPMPDFAYRNDEWICAPVALDATGSLAYNLQGLNAGYLTDAARNLNVSLWKRQAQLLFAALSDKTAPEKAYAFEAEDGRLLSFANKAEFDAAVNADLKVRELEAKVNTSAVA